MAIMMNSKGTTEYKFKIGAKGPTIYSDATTQNLYINGIATANQILTAGFTTSSAVSMSMGSYNLTATNGVTINNKKIKAVITGYTIDTTNETINLTIEDVDVAPSN